MSNSQPAPHGLVAKAKGWWQWWTSLRSDVQNTAKYLILLVSLESLTWTAAFYGEGQAAPPPGIDWEDINVLITLLAGIYAISRTKRVLAISSTLAVFALVGAWTSELMHTTSWSVAGDMCMALFFGFTACMVLRDIWKAERVTGDTVIGSICAYMLIGATWAFLYSLVEWLVPGSFSCTAANPATPGVATHHDYPSLMYFSFVTLASLGYGDVIPIKGAARMLATAEAIVGQFYVAVLVARLVSLQIAHKHLGVKPKDADGSAATPPGDSPAPESPPGDAPTDPPA